MRSEQFLLFLQLFQDHFSNFSGEHLTTGCNRYREVNALQSKTSMTVKILLIFSIVPTKSYSSAFLSARSVYTFPTNRKDAFFSPSFVYLKPIWIPFKSASFSAIKMNLFISGVLVCFACSCAICLVFAGSCGWFMNWKRDLDIGVVPCSG